MSELQTIPEDWRVSSYDYELPPECIAQSPAGRRDASRLLVARRASGEIVHTVFSDLGRFLDPGDLLVLNDTRVMPARLFGERTTGGKVEMLLIREAVPGKWEAMLRAGGSPRPGEAISFENNRLVVRLIERRPGGVWLAALPRGVDLLRLLEEIGRAPLPPYIRRGATDSAAVDRERYQTVYARAPGAIAAPTAGLHFTRELLAKLEERGIGRAWVTLHVGPGTFRPVRHDDIRLHPMHREPYLVPPETVDAIAAARAAGKRVVAVGTTSCRALESAVPLVAGAGESALFIYPPFVFRQTDALITNFHLPRSTLLMLVAALFGRERLLAIYETARSEGYRFYSYGDAMLII